MRIERVMIRTSYVMNVNRYYTVRWTCITSTVYFRIFTDFGARDMPHLCGVAGRPALIPTKTGPGRRSKSACLGPLAGCGGFGGEVLGKLGGGASVSVMENVAADTLGACSNEQVRPVTPTLEEAPKVLAA